MSAPPWNDWYHINTATYGTWLRGDPRGWRARHHREHVDGDYKKPPPKGKYDWLHAYSKWLMKRQPVHINDPDRRQFIVSEVGARLVGLDIPLLIAVLDDHHLHGLAKCVDHRPKHWLGIAKKHASHMVRDLPDSPIGGLWAKGSKATPIEHRRHQIEVVYYLLEHVILGAALWIAPALLPKLPAMLDIARDRVERKRARRWKK